MARIIDGPVIPAGGSLSYAADISGGKIVGIITPSGWTPAVLTFQVSPDGASYNDLYDTEGNEIAIMISGNNSAIMVEDHWSRHINFIKFRSGTAMCPVPQEATRRFAVVVEIPDHRQLVMNP